MICVEDLRTRMVTVWKIVLLFSLSLAYLLFTTNNITEQLKLAAFNICVIAIIYSGLIIKTLYTEKKFSVNLNGKIGLADLLLILPPALCFSNFIFMYFILICIFCGILYSLFLFLSKEMEKITIPLAGISSLLFCISLLLLHLFNIDAGDNNSLFEKFILP